MSSKERWRIDLEKYIYIKYIIITTKKKELIKNKEKMLVNVRLESEKQIGTKNTMANFLVIKF